MSGIEKHTGTYDENLTDIRNLKPPHGRAHRDFGSLVDRIFARLRNSKVERADGPFSG